MRVDLNKAREADNFEVAPDGLYYLKITLRPGGFGDDDLLKRSKSGALDMIEMELEVAEGEYAGVQFREWISVSLNEYMVTDKSKLSGLKTAVSIGHKKIVQIINSAKALDPDDRSPATEAERAVDFKELNGLTFLGYVESKTYNDRENNFLDHVVTADMVEWRDQEEDAAAAAAPPTKHAEFDDEVPF